QAEALMLGRTAPTDQPWRAYGGNRPSVMIKWRQLSPRTLGRLIALYEHRVLVEGAIWGINSYDQWGVELGKNLALELEPQVRVMTDPLTEV
ncbi:MAG: glucose-6-phosphate isomerase, partial [Alphaproteobacteria bacterium]|nr:glucose-6-phosphate isomerase [Alphaproteobacteria bacterium]